MCVKVASQHTESGCVLRHRHNILSLFVCVKVASQHTESGCVLR